MSKFVLLRFDSAKVVVSQLNEYFDQERFIEEPINWQNVSNMLHVMVGSRPVPSYDRKLIFDGVKIDINTKTYERSEILDEIAKKALVCVTNSYYHINKYGKVILHSDYTQGKGGMHGAEYNNHKKFKTMSKSGKIYDGRTDWETLRLYYSTREEENYEKYLNVMKKCLGDDVMEKYDMIDALEEVSNNKAMTDYAIGELENIVPKCITDTIMKVDEPHYEVLTKNCTINRAAQVNHIKPVPKVALYGKILVELPNDIFNLLHNGKRCATFLDGGCVHYKGEYFESDEINIGDYLNLAGYKKLKA